MGIGQYLTPVFDFVDAAYQRVRNAGWCVLGVVAAIKLIKFGTGVIDDAKTLIKAFTSAGAAKHTDKSGSGGG